MRIITVLFMVVLLMIMATTLVFAGIIDTVKSHITGEVLAFIVSAVLAILAGFTGILYSKITKVATELGEFLQTLGAALDDKKITREELSDIVKKGRDLFTALGRKPG